MRTKAQYSELEVQDVCMEIGKKKILSNIRMEARSGDLLAIMGPTGSGKTTLLNIIAGRLKPTSGSVTLNNDTFSKRLRRRLAFVQQQDVFFSQLTLWETLYFTARIRLPDSMSEADKRKKIDDIVDTLDIRKCLHTVIGDLFTRGLSGGEKKRASVACELLTDPDILLLDEPTSGLDSSTALSLMMMMKTYAQHYNKTIIVTIHQPSSQIYHMCNNILLLINGQEGYYGSSKDALDYFERLGLTCEPHFNPADFILQIAKSDEETVAKVIAEAERSRSLLTPKDKTAADSSKPTANNTTNLTDDHKTNGDLNKGHDLPADTAIDVEVKGDDSDVKSNLIEQADLISAPDGPRRRWVTSWWTQYTMLSWRSFKQTKGVLMQGYSIVQMFIISLVTGAIYFQIDHNVTTIRDIMGLLFFAVTYWTFNPAFETITTFPTEKGVLTKERSAGSYRLSAYYLAKITSDLPLTFILPTLMYTLLFVMSGVAGVEEFFMTYPIILLQVLLSQAFGFVVGVIFLEIKPALTTFVSYSLCAFMIGGFFTQNVPECLTWAKYLSSILYAYGAICSMVINTMPAFPCNETSTRDFPQCASNTTDYIYPKDILHNAGLTLELHFYIWPIFVIIVGFRCIGYVILRYRKPKML